MFPRPANHPNRVVLLCQSALFPIPSVRMTSSLLYIIFNNKKKKLCTDVTATTRHLPLVHRWRRIAPLISMQGDPLLATAPAPASVHWRQR